MSPPQSNRHFAGTAANECEQTEWGRACCDHAVIGLSCNGVETSRSLPSFLQVFILKFHQKLGKVYLGRKLRLISIDVGSDNTWTRFRGLYSDNRLQSDTTVTVILEMVQCSYLLVHRCKINFCISQNQLDRHWGQYLTEPWIVWRGCHCTHCEGGGERPTVKYLVNLRRFQLPGKLKSRPPRSRTRWCSGRRWILHRSESDCERRYRLSGSRNRRGEEAKSTVKGEWVQNFMLSLQGYKFRCGSIGIVQRARKKKSSCSCLTLLPGPAWVLFSKIYKYFPGFLYIN